jgi:hypothetical protein
VEGKGWINLAQETNKRQAIVDAVMNLLFPYDTGIFFTS